MKKFTLALCLLAFFATTTTAQHVVEEYRPASQSAPATKTAPAEDERTIILVQLLEAELSAQLFAIDPQGHADKKGAAARVAELYAKIAADPELTQRFAGNVVSDFSGSKFQARSAMQVSQAADEASVKLQMLLISQNERIIALLEQLVRKR